MSNKIKIIIRLTFIRETARLGAPSQIVHKTLLDRSPLSILAPTSLVTDLACEAPLRIVLSSAKSSSLRSLLKSGLALPAERNR